MTNEKFTKLICELDDLIVEGKRTGVTNLERKCEIENLLAPEMNGAFPIYTPDVRVL